MSESLERRAEELIAGLRHALQTDTEGAYEDQWARKTIDLIEQLLSENRQVREADEGLRRIIQDTSESNVWVGRQWVKDQEWNSLRAHERAEAAEARVRELERREQQRVEAMLALPQSDPAHTIASLRQDLDRISAEREAYREALKQIRDEGPLWWDESAPRGGKALSYSDLARRILAENDR